MRPGRTGYTHIPTDEMRSHTGANRREFLKLGAGALSVAAGASLLPAAAIAAPPKYTGVTYFPPSYEDMFPPQKTFAEKLQQHPDLMSVEFFDSGKLVKADEQVSALRAGTVDFMFHTTTYITGTFPILGVIGMPGVAHELYKHGDRLKMESPLWKLLNDNLAKRNMFMLTAGGGVMEPEYIWSRSKPVNTLEDLKGMRIRVVGEQTEQILSKYGAGSTRLPSSEVYLAMDRGTVDGAALNLSTIMGRRLYEHIKYGYKLPMTTVSIAIFMMKDRWDKLPEKVKAAYWEAAQWYDQNDARIINEEFYDKKYWPAIKEKGIEVVEPSEAEMADFHEKCEKIWADWKNKVGAKSGQRALDLALGNA